MNRKLDNLIQELFLAVINGNEERANRLIRQMPKDTIEKTAYGAAELFRFALRFLPTGEAEAIRRAIQEEAAAAGQGSALRG